MLEKCMITFAAAFREQLFLQGHTVMSRHDIAVKPETSAQPKLGKRMSLEEAELAGQLGWAKLYAVAGLEDLPGPQRNQKVLLKALLALGVPQIVSEIAQSIVIWQPILDAPLEAKIAQCGVEFAAAQRETAVSDNRTAPIRAATPQSAKGCADVVIVPKQWVPGLRVYGKSIGLDDQIEIGRDHLRHQMQEYAVDVLDEIGEVGYLDMHNINAGKRIGIWQCAEPV